MSSSQTVAAVIVTYNRKVLLSECLQALLGQTRPIDGIILIDNASTDGTPEFLKEKGFLDNPKIDYVRLPKNTGGAGGFHEGVKRGHEEGFDWLWVMDDDAEPEKNALEKLFEIGLHQKNDTVGLACLKVGVDGRVQRIHRGWYMTRKLKAIPLSDEDFNKQVSLIGYSSFVGLLIRSSTIKEIGLPRNDFFIYFDDLEYSLRLLSEGKLYLVGDSVIKHKDGRVESGPKKEMRLPAQQYWRAYYDVRNPLLILKAYERTVLGRSIGYTTGGLKLLRKLIAVAIYDDRKFLRSKILLKAFADGIAGQSGKVMDPSVFRDIK